MDKKIDPLLRGNSLAFSIDEIAHIKEKEKEFYNLHIIPDTDSKYFPPYHLRNISIPETYLQFNLFRYLNPESNKHEESFTGSVEQGGYYIINSADLEESKAFSGEVISNDIFKGRKEEFPYKLDFKKPLDGNEIPRELSFIKNLKSVNIYCFKVGQGDSFLLITSGGNSYLIDTNIYNEKNLEEYIGEVKRILRKHSLNDKRLTGLITTHKHIDHLRGSDLLLQSDEFKIDNLFINLDYEHNTKAVINFLETASKKIANWINVNHSLTFIDSGTTICIRNPILETSTKEKTPDINDSSICLCIAYGNCKACLTGDASFKILNQCYKCTHLINGSDKRFLKIAHHGSITGTDEDTLNLINPEHSFISAGNSKKYKHPHKETLELLKAKKIPTKISKELPYLWTCYTMNGNRIDVSHNK